MTNTFVAPIKNILNDRCSILFDSWSSKALLAAIKMSHLVRKQTMWFPTRSDTNQAVQSQKQARSLNFRI